MNEIGLLPESINRGDIAPSAPNRNSIWAGVLKDVDGWVVITERKVPWVKERTPTRKECQGHSASDQHDWLIK